MSSHYGSRSRAERQARQARTDAKCQLAYDRILWEIHAVLPGTSEADRDILAVRIIDMLRLDRLLNVPEVRRNAGPWLPPHLRAVWDAVDAEMRTAVDVYAEPAAKGSR